MLRFDIFVKQYILEKQRETLEHIAIDIQERGELDMT